jgi:hypothetical protein
MRSRVSASARLSLAAREQLGEQFALHLDPAAEVRHLWASLDAERLDIVALQEMTNTDAAKAVFETLAPREFERACELLARAGFGTEDQQALAMSVQAELTAAVSVAEAAVKAATRDLTAGAVLQAAFGLYDMVSAWRGATATDVELRRGPEVILLRIYDGGDMDIDHAGLLPETCGERQLRLEQAVQRRGITLARRRQHLDEACAEPRARTGNSGNTSCSRVPDPRADDADAAQASVDYLARRAVTGARAAGGQTPITKESPHKEHRDELDR